MTPASDEHTTDAPLLRVDVIRRIEELAPLASDWDSVLRRSRSNVLYLTYEWLTTWWQCCGAGRELFVMVVRQDAEIVAIAPCMLSTERLLGLPVRVIEFISAAASAEHPSSCSGSLDIICAGDPDVVMRAIFTALEREQSAWQFIRLLPIPGESQTIPAIEQEALRRNFALHRRSAVMNAVVYVTDPWETYTARLSKRFRRHVRVNERALRELGTIACVEARSIGENGITYDDLLDIERRSWKWTAGVALNSAVLGGFYERILDVAARAGWLRLWMLKLNDEWVAYDYCLVYDNMLEALKKSFDERYKDLFPGGVLEWNMCERLFNEGICSVNFLWGDFGYKQHWHPVIEEGISIVIYGKGGYPRLLRFLDQVVRLPDAQRFVFGIFKRLLRKMGFHPRFSELTRSDQLQKPGQKPEGRSA